MREIKFRAWDKDNWEMHYSDKEEENGEGMIFWHLDWRGIWFEEPCLIDYESGGEHMQEIQMRTPNQILMQFTGLHDKNGKELYEYMELDNAWRVIWDNGKYVLQNISDSDIIKPFNKEDINGRQITREYSPLEKD